MSDNDLANWKKIIQTFFQEKHDKDLIKYIKSALKEAEQLYKKQESINNDFSHFIDARKHRKPDNLSDVDYQKTRFSKLIDFSKELSFLDKIKIEEEYQNTKSKLAKKYHPTEWLDFASTNSSSVTFATHVAKLTHSKIDSPSLYDNINTNKNNTLTTFSLKEIETDGAVAGNQFAPIYQFLILENKGLILAEALTIDGKTILESFTDDKEQLNSWLRQFKEVTQASELSTHSLAKQIYFPIDKGNYHLLSNMISSSVAHHVFTELFNNDMRKSRKKYFEKKYSKNYFFDYPYKAALSATASNHSNASQLNGKRSGKLYLFNAQPPTWQIQIEPPARFSSMFNVYAIKDACTDDINSLRKMLVNAQDIYRKPEILRGLENWCKSIADEVLTYASQMQQIESGWSKDSHLAKQSISHCYLLDPYRNDPEFVTAQKNNDWQETISKHFGYWLNQELAGKDKQFTPQVEHRKIWQRVFAHKLRDFMETVLVGEKSQ